MTTTYGPVTQDGVEVFQAHYDPEKRWNGSLVPSFDRAEAEKVAAHLMAPPDDDITHMEWDGDVVIYTRPDDPSFAPVRIDPDENGLYDIGNHLGSWQVPEEDECETDEDQQDRATPDDERTRADDARPLIPSADRPPSTAANALADFFWAWGESFVLERVVPHLLCDEAESLAALFADALDHTSADQVREIHIASRQTPCVVDHNTGEVI